MARNLGLGVAMQVTGFSPDLVVLVGDVTSARHRVGHIVNETVRQRLSTPLRPQILTTAPRTQPCLRGAVALVLHEHFVLSQVL
jgi:hypothetical protein